jgi:hypothetical protein
MVAFVTVFALMSLSVAAYACDYVQQTVKEWNGSCWVTIDKYAADKKAALYTSGGASGACDKRVWTASFLTHASIGQWIDWSFSSTSWDWQIRKPGTYASDGVSFTIQSNNDITVTFSGFDPLASLTNPAWKIPAWYAFSDDPTGSVPASWWAAKGSSADADNINKQNWVLSYDSLKGTKSYKVWSKIQVDPTTHSCEYEDSGTVTMTLQPVKPWISAALGNFYGSNDDEHKNDNPQRFLDPSGNWYQW